MKIAYFGYRKWSEKIIVRLTDELDERNINVHVDSYTPSEKSEYVSKQGHILLDNPKDFEKVPFGKYDLILFYGWSWIIPDDIIKNNKCICLHPSKLPLYRGGSPIQNQLLNGETESAVTLFQMNSVLDGGPIYEQEPFSLEGDSLDEIFDRIIETGVQCTLRMLDMMVKGGTAFTIQNEACATVYKRRKPKDSELNTSKLSEMSTLEIHNFIKALQTPYPNAYIEDDVGRVYFESSRFEKITETQSTQATQKQNTEFKCKKLIVSPHVDDEVLGCGGILDKDSFVLYCGADESALPKDILEDSATRCTLTQRMQELKDVSEYLGFEYKVLTDTFVNHYKTVDLICHIERAINEHKPEEVYIPWPSYNQDHKAVYEACLIALRPHDKNHYVKKVLVYEQPHMLMWDQDVMKVNYFVPIDIERKKKAYTLHASQVRSFRPVELLTSIAHLRGVQSNQEYAEAFYIQRWIN
jgi:methionyl-tRNA formyltransferase/LmbE family N-acetylglucosaminyl deacetylase